MKNIIFLIAIFFASATSSFASGHVATATGINPTCNGVCNGSAYAMASGGVGPYGYTWSGPSGYTGAGQNINGLCAGVYMVTAIDSSDMSTAVYTLNLIQPSQLVITVSNGGAICFGNSVSLSAVASGGTPGYNYSWSPSAGLSNPNIYNPIAAPSTTTTYTVTVTDASGCTKTSSTTVIVNPNPTITVNSPTICAGQPAVLFANGASSYSWSPGGMTGNPYTVVPTVTTSYTVTGTAAGCAGYAISTVTVNQPPAISLSPTPATCGACNGAITTSASGATTFSWTGQSGYSSTVMNPTNLCQGSYTLTATNATGCSSNAVTTVSNSSSVVATIGSITPATCGACDGSATVYASGGSAPYTYMWSPSGTTAQTATNLCSGVYTVMVIDANGCNFSATITIPSSSTLTGTVSSSPTACGACNGSANITASGGTGPYTYNWSPGNPTGDGTTGISGLCLGTYTVIVTDGNGCTYAGSTTINNTNPVYVTGNATSSTCGACNGTVTIIATGGVTPYLYSLNNGTPQSNGTFSGICAGTYVATVTDVNGCSGIYTLFVSPTNTSNFTVSDSIQNESGYGLYNGAINLTISGSAPPYTFAWSNGATTEDIYSLAAGSYSVVITDNNGDCATYYYSVSTVSSYGYITGYLYNDNNSNCVDEAGDAPLTGYYVSATNGVSTYFGYTNTNGYYSIWVPTGNFTVTPYNTVNLEAACTNSYTVNVTSGGTFGNNNFSYTIPPVYDVCVYTWCNGIVPGFNGAYNVYLYNNGNQNTTGNVYLVLPGLVNYISSSPAASSVSGDTIFWNYTNMPPYSSLYYSVTFNTPASAALGTTTIAYVNAAVTNGTDANPGCNSYAYTRIVTGSFDPNEKTVSPSGENASGDISLTEDEFTYLIRFQNTGSGPAVNINVTDTLSSMLDPMSFQMLNASHNYVVELLPGNVIRWQFNNIILPDSTSNETGSHGHIQFRIAKLNSPSAGQIITNKANIYFDFNAPIVTNTAINTYVLATTIEEQANENGRIKVYPNPFTDNTTFVIQSDKLNETYSFEMTDVLGKVVKQMNVSEKQFTISRNDLKNGMYFYKIHSAETIVGIGKLIIK